MLERRGVDWSASFGAFHEGKLIGAITTAIDEWPAEHIGAYGALTAVRRGSQRRGVLTALFDWLKLALDHREVTQMQIEVRFDDPRARAAYERLGFDVDRHLFCFELPRLQRAQRFIEELRFEVHLGPEAGAAQDRNGALWASFWTLLPAWGGSTWTVARTPGRVAIEALWLDEVVGYAVLEPEAGELMQLAVREDLRRRGIGTELVRACQEAARRPTLTIDKVDDGDDRGVSVAFFRALGAKLSSVQLEMVLNRVY
nr:GNAT family N-acetyltransferase [Pseudenhygromyxa sp. WMMC2535]